MYAIRSYYEVDRVLGNEEKLRRESFEAGDGEADLVGEDLALRGLDPDQRARLAVITSYSIHYTKLYEPHPG